MVLTLHAPAFIASNIIGGGNIQGFVYYKTPRFCACDHADSAGDTGARMIFADIKAGGFKIPVMSAQAFIARSYLRRRGDMK
ncbi:MAG: hypothetical protein UY09_C0005G0022 [Parcubacteria group bacterium GW2011_GWA2_47_8]|nr:MAG: hypothetical protein UY09_C0005G0022 [Parcubacteria group bacterium GW2011_GWA2_47_8]OHB18711.1 MAG: hypothetical protein A2666_02540 [Parcubacteria group bacterium RIFCSPHIGHO2_01_FULL_47_10b]